MAIKKCKECGKEVSTSAKVCPHCGKKHPVGGLTLPAKIGLVILVLWAIGYMVGKNHDTSSSSQSASSSESKTTESGVLLTEGGGKIKDKHPQWSNDDCNTIAEKQIRIGMTAEQVEMAWGKPHQINSTVRAKGEHQQWVMYDSIRSDYLYFDSGILTSIQQSK